MRLAAVFAVILAGTAQADPALLDFMGGQGCTFGADSRAAAISAGFEDADIDALIEGALSDGTARRQGDYVVLNESLCKIRLPNINSPYSVTSPEIVAITSTIDAFSADGFAGCFLQDPIAHFDVMKSGKHGAGFFDYVEFVAANLISGDITFFGKSSLSTPLGFQVATGDCAKVPQIEGIRRSHSFLVAGFGPMIRRMGAENLCSDRGRPTVSQIDGLVRLQGGDPDASDSQGPEANAWLWMEIVMISVASGWYGGMNSTQKGNPRPPLCHYP